MKNSQNKFNPFEEAAAEMPSLINAFEAFVRKQAYAFSKDIRDIARVSISPKGKYIRPILTFSAAGKNAEKSDSLVRRAAIGELIHLSTLIHDDVIDNASVRRSAETPNKKYGAHTAILLGDAIFARTMQLAFFENDNPLLGKIAECVRTICEGEITQTLINCEKNISKKQYYQVVHGKTGVLFSLACSMGAECCQPKNLQWIDAATEVGKQLGIAYQIYDDICDWFMSEADAGKTLGTDLMSGKHTFPLIVLFEELPAKRAKQIAKNLKNENPEEILLLMRQLNVPEKCRAEFMRRINMSEKILAKFPDEGEPLMRFCNCMKKLSFA